MAPTTVVRFTLPQRSPVPMSVPWMWRAPARIAARVLAMPRPRSVWPWKSELRAGKIADEAGDDLRNFFGAGAAVGVADDDAADFLLNALFDELVKVVEAALGEIAAAGIAVFTAAAAGVHGVLEIDEDFEALLLQNSRWSRAP